jgi:hypothetical protein
MRPEMVMGLLRHILTFAGGALVSMGYLTEANVEAIIGAVMTLAGVGWSLVNKVPPPPPPKG